MPQKETVIDFSQFPQFGSPDFELMAIDEYGMYDLCTTYILEATSHPSGEWSSSKIPCEIFIHNNECGGGVELIRYDLPSQIKWRCKKCKDHGKITNFEGTEWDIRHLSKDEQQQIMDSYVDVGDPMELIEQLPEDELQDFMGFVDQYMDNIGAGEAMRENSGGLSSQQLYQLLKNDWGAPESLVKLNDGLSLGKLDHALFFHNAREFLHYLEQEGAFPGTSAGNLKRKTVEALIDRLRWPEGYIEEIRELYTDVNEKYVWLLHEIRVLLELSGLIQFKKGAFRLTKKHRKLLDDDYAGQLYCRLFHTYFTEMNMGYISSLSGPWDLQHSISYTLYKLSLQDHHWQSTKSMADDILLPSVRDQLGWKELSEIYLYNCLIKPLVHFGLFETKNPNGGSYSSFDTPGEFRKKPLFDELLTFDIDNTQTTQSNGLNANVIPLNNKPVTTKKQNTMEKRDQEIYQLKISLNDIKPPIWRRLLIFSDTLLPDLHKIIQSSMGWTNSHLHQFEKNGHYYSAPPKDDWPGLDSIDYRNVRLDDLLKAGKQKITYEYDFGDGWNHTILLEKTLPVDPNMQYPVCTAGKRSCPPEDCGGPWGYQEMLDILNDPGHEEYEMMKDWVGAMSFEEFDPEKFDKERINRLLQSKNYGMLDLF